MTLTTLVFLSLALEAIATWPGGYSSFTFTAQTTTRYATPVKSPLPSQTYAPHLKELSTLLPPSLTYTTYSLDPTATVGGKYGQSAYAALWKPLTYSNTNLPFTATVSPTPVPTSLLFFPPARYEPCSSSLNCLNAYYLPEDFVWGVASSSWQVEGGTMSEGRGPSFLDQRGALPRPAENPMNDSVVSDMHYFLYKHDIARLAAIGIPYYSFAISWPRIVPFGVPGSPINQLGLDHNDDVIETCLSYGITPIVTLTHADIPLVLGSSADLGYSNEKFVDSFLYYAKIVLAQYADRVLYWVTINEPSVSFGLYSAHRNILMAHAKTSRFYKEEICGFLSLDAYDAFFVYPPPNGIEACASNSSDPSWPVCVLMTNVGEGGWLNGDGLNDYAYITPQYFRQALKYPCETFHPAAIAITEFGFNSFMEYARAFDAQRYDYERTEYYYGFLHEMLKATYEDGINIIGAIAWSILDNNEFGTYSQQYELSTLSLSTLEVNYWQYTEMDMTSPTSTTSSASATSTMEMSMGGGSSCKIDMLWNWYTVDACFISRSWHITSKGMFAGAFLGAFVFSWEPILLDRSSAQEEATFTTAENVTIPDLAFAYQFSTMGGPRFPMAMAAHINEYFNPFSPVKPEHIITGAGLTAIHEMIALSLGDPRDGILVSRPMYSRFELDFGNTADLHIVYADMDGVDPFSLSIVEKYQTKLDESARAGVKVKALLIVNPHNPLGQCYLPSTLRALMKFCEKNSIHLTSDEVYALSVYDTDSEDSLKFTSVLSIDPTGLINIEKLQVFYGMSKDFAAGLRLGCLITQNTLLHKAISANARFHGPSGMAIAVGTAILEDGEFVASFLQLCHTSLRESRAYMTKILDEAGIKYHSKANARPFLYVDLSPWLPPANDVTEGENAKILP
ncbi:hypothetical protein B7463_g8830, partial [Scytalidium lignicola]